MSHVLFLRKLMWCCNNFLVVVGLSTYLLQMWKDVLQPPRLFWAEWRTGVHLTSSSHNIMQQLVVRVLVWILLSRAEVPSLLLSGMEITSWTRWSFYVYVRWWLLYFVHAPIDDCLWASQPRKCHLKYWNLKDSFDLYVSQTSKCVCSLLYLSHVYIEKGARSTATDISGNVADDTQPWHHHASMPRLFEKRQCVKSMPKKRLKHVPQCWNISAPVVRTIKCNRHLCRVA